MERFVQESVLFHFSQLEDPRVVGRCKHNLIDIIAIAVCARICGAECFTEMEEFARQRLDWLKGFLELPNGTPSHDTIERVFSILDPEAFEDAFFAWIQEYFDKFGNSKRISLDGKCVNGTFRKFRGPGRPLTLLNAFCHETGIALGQRRAPSTGNSEVQAAVSCLDALDIAKSLITVDAGLGKKSVFKKIRDKKADYLAPVKRNLNGHFNELKEHWDKKGKSSKIQIAKTEERSRDRFELRKCLVMNIDGLSDRFRVSFPEVKTIIKITRTRDEKDRRYNLQLRDENGKNYYKKNENMGGRRSHTEVGYYVSSRKLTATSALSQIRTHWGIESRLHWNLDIHFSEDDCRVRNKAIARNLALVRKIAFNLIQSCPQRGSKKLKMKRASWNIEYLQSLLTQALPKKC